MLIDTIIEYINKLQDNNALFINFANKKFAYIIKIENKFKCIYSTGESKYLTIEDILEICNDSINYEIKLKDDITNYIQIALKNRIKICLNDPNSIISSIKNNLKKLNGKHWVVKNDTQYTGKIVGAIITENDDYYYLMLLHKRKIAKIHYTKTFVYPKYISIFFGIIQWLIYHDKRFLHEIIIQQLKKTDVTIDNIYKNIK